MVAFHEDHMVKCFRGVVLVDVLDIENASYNGWLYQPRATTDHERSLGLVRVCKL